MPGMEGRHGVNKFGKLIEEYSQRMGDTTGTLKITYPVTPVVKAGGNPFNKRPAGTQDRVFAGVRGDMRTDAETNEEGTGTTAKLAGKFSVYHERFRTSFAELYRLLKTEGAVVRWNDTVIIPTSILEDTMRDCTVVEFTRSDVT